MSRYARKVDANQDQVIAELEKIPGLTVQRNHDDFLCGLLGFTFWIELKSDQAKKKGGYRKGAVKKSQEQILQTFTGHYIIAGNYNEIVQNMILFFDKLKPYNFVSENLRRFLHE